MTNITSHTQKSEPPNARLYPGESAGTEIVNWLNGSTDEEGKQRVISLLKLWQEFESLKGTQATANMHDWHAELVPIVRTLNLALARYSFTPAIVPYVADLREAWKLHFIPAKGKRRDENYIVAMLVYYLAPLGRLGRVRQCKNCERWFFARFEHHRFCTNSECARNFRESQPEFREKRKEYMRKRYAQNIRASLQRKRAVAANSKPRRPEAAKPRSRTKGEK